MSELEDILSFVAGLRTLATDAALLAVISLCERSGVFRAMARTGPRTLEAVAEEAGVDRAHLKTALAALAAAGIVRYQPEERTYALGDHAASCLADRDGPFFAAGVSTMVCGLLETLPLALESFKRGSGIPNDRFSDAFVLGFDQVSRAQYRAALCSAWLPHLEGISRKLEGGGRAADVGCGSGAAALSIAESFAASRVLGIDLDARAIARASERAAGENRTNVRFIVGRAEDLPIEEPFDLILAFGVLHNLPDPTAALGAIRRALAKDGAVLIMQPKAKDALEENLDEAGTMAFALSTLYSVPLARSQGGEGLGGAWGPGFVEQLSERSGFARCRLVPIPHPMNAFYELRLT